MFEKLRSKIEKNRNSEKVFWRICVGSKNFVWRLFQVVIQGRENPEKIFGDIYKNKVWGEKGDFFSGTGTLSENTAEYRKFIEEFIKEKKIKSVVDLGCGDFQIGKKINWNKATYKGIDIVPFLIKRNNKLYSSQKIRFIKRDIIKDKLPDAELCIIKEVFQHFPNKAILKVLKKIRKYKYVIITDCMVEGNRGDLNKEIRMGEKRGEIDLRIPPFNKKIEKIIEYKREDLLGVFRIVLIKNKVKNEKSKGVSNNPHI